MTGQILDADIILTDGWIRYYDMQYNEILPKLAMEGYSPQTLAWLQQHPTWDPRILLAPPAERQRMLLERTRMASMPHGGHPIANVKTDALGDDEFDGLVNRVSQKNGLCMAADGKGFDLAVMRMTLDMLAYDDDEGEDEEDDDDDDEEEEDEEDDEDEDEDEEEEDEDEDEEVESKKRKKEDTKEKKDDDEDEQEDDEDERQGRGRRRQRKRKTKMTTTTATRKTRNLTRRSRQRRQPLRKRTKAKNWTVSLKSSLDP